MEKGKFPVEWKLTHSSTLRALTCYLDHCAEPKYSNISTGMFVVKFSLWHVYCIIPYIYLTAGYFNLNQSTSNIYNRTWLNTSFHNYFNVKWQA